VPGEQGKVRNSGFIGLIEVVALTLYYALEISVIAALAVVGHPVFEEHKVSIILFW